MATTAPGRWSSRGTTALITGGDTAIGSGSTVTVQPGAAFLGGTLTIAGATNAWTGKLDVTSAPVSLSGASLATISNQVKVGSSNGTVHRPGHHQ